MSVRRTSRAIGDEDRASIEALYERRSRHVQAKGDLAYHGCFIFLLPVVGTAIFGVLLGMIGMDPIYGYLIGLGIAFTASMMLYASSLRSLRDTRARFEADRAASRDADELCVVELDVRRAWRVWPNDDLTPLLCELEDGTFALVFDLVMPEDDETATRELTVVFVPPGEEDVLRLEWRGSALEGVIGEVLAEQPNDGLLWSVGKPVRILTRQELPPAWLAQLPE